MFRSIAEKLLRRRIGLFLIVALAVMLMAANEWSYQVAHRRSADTERVTAAQASLMELLLAVSTAQAAQRGFLLGAIPSGNAEPDFERPRKRAARPLAALEASLGALGRPDAAGDARALRDLTDRKFSEMQETVRLARAGQLDAALEITRSGIGEEYWHQINRLVTPALEHGSSVLVDNRERMDNALAGSRWAIHLLTALGLLSIYVFVHQLQLMDAERASHQALLEAEHRQLDEQVRRRTEELRELTTHLQAAQEDERARIARELHDELGGLFTASKLEVARITPKIKDDTLRPGLSRLTGFLNDGIALKRRIIEDLQPSSLRALGLPNALEVLCMETSERLNVPIRTDIEEPLTVLPPVDLTIYRFVQEALTNIAKYASARRVEVRVARSGPNVSVSVSDDGVGFDTTALRVGSHGLAGMRFRVESHGGTMQIASRPGAGSTLSATIPAEESATVSTESA